MFPYSDHNHNTPVSPWAGVQLLAGQPAAVQQYLVSKDVEKCYITLSTSYNSIIIKCFPKAQIYFYVIINIHIIYLFILLYSHFKECNLMQPLRSFLAGAIP